MLSMSAFQLCLPGMVMGVNETRCDNLALAINNVRRRIRGDVFPNLFDSVSDDENVRISQSMNIVIGVVLEDYATLE